MISKYLIVATLLAAQPLFAIQPLQGPVEDLIKASPKDSFLIIYGADWCASSALLKKYMEAPEIKEIVKKGKVKVYYADCTKPDSIGTKDAKKRGVHATPVPTIALWKNNGVVSYLHDVNITSIQTFSNGLKTLLGSK